MLRVFLLASLLVMAFADHHEDDHNEDDHHHRSIRTCGTNFVFRSGSDLLKLLNLLLLWLLWLLLLLLLLLIEVWWTDAAALKGSP